VLAFESIACFVNPAHAKLSYVKTQDSRLVVASTGDNAVFLVTGCIAKSFLRQPYNSGYSTDKPVHHLRIVPMSQEFQIALAYIGNAFGVRDLAGPMSGPTFALSTQKEGAGTGCESLIRYGIYSGSERCCSSQKGFDWPSVKICITFKSKRSRFIEIEQVEVPWIS
jgi:hypothetical protein